MSRASGEARMVDVCGEGSNGPSCPRSRSIRMHPATLAAIRPTPSRRVTSSRSHASPGFSPRKRTPELIPLCHPIPLTDLQMDLRPDDALPGIMAEAYARATWKTGVEMEALTAVTVAFSRFTTWRRVWTAKWNSAIYR